ncbi:MAG: HD-GYP domain-containing protein [Clostridiales bacterium]|nr:HD-GYP domain-containing protein [Clostridiales bacterium]
MKVIKVSEIEVGMILASPIFLGSSDVELLSKGVEITERHIQLMNRLGIDEITIANGPEKIEDVETSNVDQVKAAQSEADHLGEDFDAESFLNELNQIELKDDDIEPVLTNVANANMVIHVLTGEGNVPIDEKHKDLVEHTQKAFNQLKTSNDLDLDSIRKDVHRALPDMIRNDDVLMRLSQLKESDNYTFDHSLRVSILATMIGKWLGYNEEQLSDLAQASLLFDIGKLKIPDFILNKPNKTKEEEFDIVKKHAQFGYSILLKTKGVTNNIKYSALQHHERMDGSGYPLRLRSGQIHEFAKIIMVCDIFDAMTNERPYKDKSSPFDAAEYLHWNAGKTLDSKIVYIFLKNLSVFYTGKEVLLSTNERGRIIYVDVNFPTRPVIQVGGKFIDLVKEKEIRIVELYS